VCLVPFENIVVSLWSEVFLIQFVDVLMHLLFLGITKATRELIYEWISETKRLSGYKIFSNNIFEPIADMGLDWCKSLVVNSGWVSDDYIVFARICKWLYYPITTLQEREAYKEPIIAVEHLYVKMCRDWLSAHGCDTNGKVHVLKAIIIDIIDYADNPPKLIEDSRCSMKVFNNLIGNLLSIISYIMRNEVTDESIDGIEREIKLFLSNLHIVQKGDISFNDDKKSKKTKSYWLSK